jgi:glycosyltransferase involved in cell wall biosynthesis
VREVVIEEGLCKAEKVKVLLRGSINGVDAASFSPERFGNKDRSRLRERYGIPADALVLGFVGRVVRDKGIAELAEAWKRLSEAFPSLHLLIVGTFETQDPLPADVEQVLRSDPKVHLAGHVDDPSSFFAAMDVVVLPTYREGLPVVPLEAAAMELPVVATMIPGCIDAVADGVTGALVPVRDAGALMEAIRKYLECPELRTRHGRAGRERVLRDFRPEDMWREIFSEYVELLREQRQGGF